MHSSERSLSVSLSLSLSSGHRHTLNTRWSLRSLGIEWKSLKTLKFRVAKVLCSTSQCILRCFRFIWWQRFRCQHERMKFAISTHRSCVCVCGKKNQNSINKWEIERDSLFRIHNIWIVYCFCSSFLMSFTENNISQVVMDVSEDIYVPAYHTHTRITFNDGMDDVHIKMWLTVCVRDNIATYTSAHQAQTLTHTRARE